MTIALDINNDGEVVGFTQEAPSVFRASYYDTEHDVLINLNDLLHEDSGWVLNRANAINDAGMIVGEGMLDGQARSFLMTVPEPSVPVSLLFGALALLASPSMRRLTRNLA